MLVEIFSDVVCPWCAIGKRRFEAALADFEHADEVAVVFRAFELDPRAPREVDGDYAERLARKYGMTRDQALKANARLTAMAAAEGLDFHFERVRPGRTFDAHRLLHHAGLAGAAVQGALKDRLFAAYFTEGAAVGRPEVLADLAADVGLDPDECAAVLASDRYAAEVRAEEQAALDIGVTGVPFFLLDGRFGIPGAQDAETILAVLRRAWAKEHSVDADVDASAAMGAAAAVPVDACGDEACAVPE
jgi:predicted DsbA family dithiol-disulfide isomerase